jgi:hypothetical protein
MFLLRAIVILVVFVYLFAVNNCEELITGKATKQPEKFDQAELELKSLSDDYFKLKHHFHNGKKNEKIYLKDLLENENGSNLEENFENQDLLPKENCYLKTIEISHKIAKCGRIKLNTTSCEGSCKSISNFILSMNYQKISCYACKAYKYEYVKHKVSCPNGVSTFLMLKSVKSCDCFKNSENIIPVKLIKKKILKDNVEI